MSTINRLSSVDVLQPSDQIPVWDSSNGDTRKASMSTLLAFVESYFADPDYSTRIVAPNADYFNVDIGSTGDSLWMIVNPTLDFSNGTLTLPPASSAVNDQEITVVFTKSVLTLVIASSGAAILGAPTQVAGYDSFRVRYNASQATWYTLDTTGTGAGGGVSQIVRQDFTGDGATTTFVLSSLPLGLGNQLQIFIDGVYQERASYTVTGLNLIFGEAPPSLSTIEVLGWTVSLGASTTANLVAYSRDGSSTVTNVAEELDRTTTANMVAYELGTTAAVSAHPGIATGYIIRTNYFDSALTSGSGAEHRFTGTTTAGKAGNWPNADGYFYDADGKQFAVNSSMPSIKVYGAIGSSLADDTALLNNLGAIAGLSLTIDVDLYVTGLTRIVFSGANQHIVFINSAKIVFDSTNEQDMTEGMVQVMGASTRIYNLTVDGGAPSTRWGAPSIRIGGAATATGIRIYNPVSLNSWGGGVMARWCNDVEIHSARVIDAKADGLNASNDSGGDTTAVRYIGGYIENSGDDCCSVVGYTDRTNLVQDIKFIGVTGIGGTFGGAIVSGGHNVQVIGNFSNLGGRGFRINRDATANTFASTNVQMDLQIDGCDLEGGFIGEGADNCQVKALIEDAGRVDDASASIRAISVGDATTPPQNIDLSILAKDCYGPIYIGQAIDITGSLVSKRSGDDGIQIATSADNCHFALLRSVNSGWSSVGAKSNMNIRGANITIASTQSIRDSATSNINYTIDTTSAAGAIDLGTLRLADSVTGTQSALIGGSQNDVTWSQPNARIDVTSGNPVVGGRTSVNLNYGVATNVTNFTDGLANQTILLRGQNANATIVNGGAIATAAGVNLAIATGKVYTFTKFGSVWTQSV